MSEHDKRERKRTCLVVKAAFPQHAACLHVVGLGGTSLLGSTGRAGKRLTLPLHASVHSIGWTEASVMVLDENTSDLKQMVNKKSQSSCYETYL